jgi:hypothetical protein
LLSGGNRGVKEQPQMQCLGIKVLALALAAGSSARAAIDARGHSLSHRPRPWQGLGAFDESVNVDQPSGDEGRGEVGVLLASGNELRDDEVVSFDATSPAWFGIGSFVGDDALFPALGKDGRRHTDALRVEGEGLMKGGSFADRAIDLIGFRLIRSLRNAMSTSNEIVASGGRSASL